MKVAWISANRFGHELLRTALEVAPGVVTDLITLSPGSSTIMYDGVDPHEWDEFPVTRHTVDRLDAEPTVLTEIAPDLVVVCGWRQIVGQHLLSIPCRGFVGFHPTLLPYGRGPAPIINSIMHGVRKSGLTLFQVGQGLDDGDIIGQEPFDIEPNDHATEVYEKVVDAGVKLITEYLPLLLAGTAPRTPQDPALAVEFDKPSLKDNELDLENDSLEMIDRKIRALSHPYRGAYISNGDDRLIIWRSEYRHG